MELPTAVLKIFYVLDEEGKRLPNIANRFHDVLKCDQMSTHSVHNRANPPSMLMERSVDSRNALPGVGAKYQQDIVFSIGRSVYIISTGAFSVAFAYGAVQPITGITLNTVEKPSIVQSGWGKRGDRSRRMTPMNHGFLVWPKANIAPLSVAG